jgi:hypothetical protein
MATRKTKRRRKTTNIGGKSASKSKPTVVGFTDTSDNLNTTQSIPALNSITELEERVKGLEEREDVLLETIQWLSNDISTTNEQFIISLSECCKTRSVKRLSAAKQRGLWPTPPTRRRMTKVKQSVRLHKRAFRG